MKVLHFPSPPSPPARRGRKTRSTVEPEPPPMLCELAGFLSAVQETRRRFPELPAELFVRAGRVRFEGFDRATQRVDVSVLLSWAAHVRAA